MVLNSRRYDITTVSRLLRLLAVLVSRVSLLSGLIDEPNNSVEDVTIPNAFSFQFLIFANKYNNIIKPKV